MTKEINKIGYCLYCKEEISNEEPYIIFQGQRYHIKCFELKYGSYNEFDTTE